LETCYGYLRRAQYSVAGLQAQSFALQNISGNIANAQTTGYKGIGTSFVDSFPDSTSPTGRSPDRSPLCAIHHHLAGNRLGIHRRHLHGDQRRRFFSVQKATGITDNVPVFKRRHRLYPSWDFQVNANGNLVNGAGYYLMGVAVDPRPETRSATYRRCCSSRTTSFRRRHQRHSIRRETSRPRRTRQHQRPAGSVLAAGDLNPGDFAKNPLVVGTPTFVNASVNGTAARASFQRRSPPQRAVRAAGSNTLTTGFAAGDTITVDVRHFIL